LVDLEKIIKKLKLIPHPSEGGFFFETYRSDERIIKDVLPDRYKDVRCFSTCIYYMLTHDSFSEMHNLQSDEIFHFYLGDPVEMLHLYPDGSVRRIIFGNDILNGMELQVVVPKNVWQGARLIDGGNFALMGTTVSPGFEFNDYLTGKRELLINNYPEYRDLIIKLTR
jgi:uncharacterized protein